MINVTVCIVFDDRDYRTVQWRHSGGGDAWKVETLEKTLAGRILFASSPGRFSRQMVVSPSDRSKEATVRVRDRFWCLFSL